MSELFESDVEDIKRIFNFIINFVVTNNKNVKTTEYYLVLDNTNFLQIIEDSFNNPILDENKKKEYIELMKTFLKKQKDLYLRFSLSDNPEALEMKTYLKETNKRLGFSGNNDNDLFSELENTINRIDKKEFAL